MHVEDGKFNITHGITHPSVPSVASPYQVRFERLNNSFRDEGMLLEVGIQVK